MPAPFRYRIHFIFTENIGGQSRIRSKRHLVDGYMVNEAVDKLKQVYGLIKILKCEKV